MAADERNAFEVYRDRVDRPLGRLFREYGASEVHWLVIGMAANVVARVAGLIPTRSRSSPTPGSRPRTARSSASR